METLDPEDWDGMRELAHRMVDDMMDYIASNRERPVWTRVPDDVAGKLEAPAPREPEGAEAVYEAFLQNILPYNLHTNHPRFWAWYMGSGTVTGALAEFLAAALNPNVGGINHVAPLVEKQVIGWITQMMGFPETASGLLTSGASMANFTALAVARNSNAGYDVRREGVQRAVGWRTWEVLEKVVMENLLICLTSVSLSVLLSMVWIKGLNGILIAQFYVAEVGLIPDVDIPSRYLPSHGVFYLIFALGVTLIGSSFSTWRKARITPTELMR